MGASIVSGLSGAKRLIMTCFNFIITFVQSCIEILKHISGFSYFLPDFIFLHFTSILDVFYSLL